MTLSGGLYDVYIADGVHFGPMSDVEINVTMLLSA
jgi:hypothetical protein